MAQTPSTQATLLGLERFPARPEDHPIEVFVSLADVQRPYVKVAHLVSTGSGIYASWKDIQQSMKAKARAVGADAIVTGPMQQQTYQFMAPMEKLQEAIAIRYTDSDDLSGRVRDGAQMRSSCVVTPPSPATATEDAAAQPAEGPDTAPHESLRFGGEQLRMSQNRLMGRKGRLVKIPS